MKRHIDITAASCTVLILMMFGFGATTSLTVPFSNTPVSFGSAVASLRQLSLREVSSDRFFWFLPILLVPVSVFLLSHRKRTRIPSIAISFLLPLLFLDPSRAVAQFLFIPFITPSITIGMFAGSLDGETWSEGFVALAALGWWIVLWLVLFFLELRRANHALESTSEPARSAAPEATQG